MQSTLFERVVAASGLASVIATSALRRALMRVGIDPVRLTSSDLEAALDSIERSLKVYLPSHRVAAQMDEIRALTRGGSRQEAS